MAVAPWDLETSLAPSLGGLGLTNPDSSVRAQKRSKARLEKQRKAPRRRWPRVVKGFMDGVWAGGGWRGSTPGRRTIMDKGREAGGSRLGCGCGWSQAEGMWTGSVEG